MQIHSRIGMLDYFVMLSLDLVSPVYSSSMLFIPCDCVFCLATIAPGSASNAFGHAAANDVERRKKQDVKDDVFIVSSYEPAGSSRYC